MSTSGIDLDAMLADLARLPPTERLARVAAAGAVDPTLVLLADAASHRTGAESARAVGETELVTALADEANATTARARARRAQARALAYVGRFDDALCVCDEALRIAEQTGQVVEAGRTRLASMHALGELGRLDDAVAAGKSARGLFLAADKPELAARADINLGIVYQRRDEPAVAIQCFDRARAVVAGDPVLAGHLENGRGEALLALDDFRAAQAAFSAALVAFEDAGADFTAAIAEGNLADLAARQGRLQRALFHYESARRRLESDGSPIHLARVLAEQAEVKALLGLSAEALEEYETALDDLDGAGLALEAARARRGMGLVLVRLGRRAEATTYFDAAATAFEELGHTTARARVDLARAELAAASGHAGKARRLAHRALAALRDRPADAAIAHELLARISITLGEVEEAEGELTTGLALARQLDLAPLLAELLATRATVRLRQGFPIGAIESLRAAARQIERIRGTIVADRFRIAFFARQTAVHERLVRLLLDQNDDNSLAEAFAVTEQAKSRTLLDQILSTSGLDARADDSGDPHEQDLRRRLEETHAELNMLYSRLADETVAAGGRESTVRWRESVRLRERELAAIEDRVGTTRGTAGLLARPIGLADARRLVDDEGLLIEYFIADDEILAFVLGSGGARVVRGLGKPADVAALLGRLQFQVSRAMRPGSDRRMARLTEDARSDLGALGRILLDPIRRHVAAARSLTIVPHGLLHLVPFHALWNGRTYMVQTHRVHVVPSASVLDQLLRAPGGHADGPPLVVGVPDDHAPQIADEARAIAAALGCPGQALVGEEATAERIRDRASRASVIHLACHGRFSSSSPTASGIRVADRWLTMRDLYALRMDAELVTLSGCETGLSLVDAGDELMGLARSLLAAGARSVLVSLWRVCDSSAEALMSSFYRRWCAAPAASHARSDALRAAMLETLERRPHPAFWAPFVLVGRSS